MRKVSDITEKRQAAETPGRRRGSIHLRIDVYKRQVEDGLKMLKDAENAGEPFNLIITDMHFPMRSGAILSLIHILMSRLE